MPEVVMKLQGSPFGPTPFDGQFLKEFDHEAFDGQGEILTTKDPAEAKRFGTMADALDFYRRVPKCRPLRPDLQPNRPLTSTNWEFLNADAA